MMNNKEIRSKIAGLLIVLLCYLSWCFMTVSYKGLIWAVASLVVTVFSAAFFSLIYRSSETKYTVLILTFIFIMLTIGVLRKAKELQDVVLTIIFFIWTITFGYKTIQNLKSNYITIRSLTSEFFRIVMTHKGFLLLLTSQIVLMWDYDMYQFKWDGLLYYLTCQNITLRSISSLAIYGHIAQSYGAIVAAVSLWIPDVGIAMISMNMFMLTMGTIYFYRLLKMIVPQRKEILYLLLTAVFAFSPYYLGMVGYHSLDFYLQCFFPIVLYYTVARKWIQQMIAAFLFCFTKEPAVIIYAGMCAGVLLTDFIERRRENFWNNCKRALNTIHYYYMLIPVVLWMVTFKMLGPWSAGNSSVGVDFSYIIEKLKVMYIFQFNWVFVVIGLVSILMLFYKRRVEKEYIWLLPMLTAQIFLTIFSCVFKTVNHPRYLDSTIPVLYIIAALGMLIFCSDKITMIISIPLATLILLSSYLTIDPLTKLIFRSVNVGTSDVVTTGALLGDSIIYNKQVLWIEHVMNKAIEDAIDENTIIVVPSIGDNTYFFDGMSTVTSTDGTYYIQDEYWNPISQKRIANPNSDSDVYQLIHISPSYTLDQLPLALDEKMSYLYFDGVGSDNLEKNLGECRIISVQDYLYRGWVLHRAIIER